MRQLIKTGGFLQDFVENTPPLLVELAAAVRLVLASRLGIEHEGDTGSGDPRFVLYEWVGVLLDAIVRTVDGE